MKAGRKRTFDKQEALDKAMRVFWDNGYSGTSIADLTSELGINKPSLYAAFGNKEQLFATSLEHYFKNYSGPVSELFLNLSEAPLKERLRAFLYGVIDVVANPESPQGCLFVKSSCELGSSALPEELSTTLKNMGKDYEQVIATLLEPEKGRGNLSEDTDITVLSGYILSVMEGLSVQSHSGKSKDNLRKIADLAVDTVQGIT